MNPHYARVAARAEHWFEYCRAPEAIFNFPLEVEHVDPLSRGGADSDDNLALACRSCNLRKAAHQTGPDPEGALDVPLFHPRRDAWSAHFVLDTDRGVIGATPTGRASIARLAMNSANQVTARLQWIRLGLLE